MAARPRRSLIPGAGPEQEVSAKGSERLAEAGAGPSVGSVGDSRGNVLAQATNGLHKAEAIHRRRPCRSLETVKLAASDWVDGLSNRRLLESIGNIPPAEANHCATLDDTPMAA